MKAQARTAPKETAEIGSAETAPGGRLGERNPACRLRVQGRDAGSISERSRAYPVAASCPAQPRRNSQELHQPELDQRPPAHRLP